MFRNLRSSVLSANRSKCLVNVADNGVATIALASPPVNTLNAELLASIKGSIDQVVADGAKAAVLTAAKPGVFSAGLDIMSMYGRTDDELREYWTHVQDMWLSLYMAPLPMIAAINGAAPAGGCLMAMSCDYRIMAKHPKFVIGLNETKLGIVAPTWFIDTMLGTIGHRESERALQLGHLYSGEEALQVGLIDELLDPADMEQAVHDQLKLWLRVPSKARIITKTLLRQETANKLINKKTADTEVFVSLVGSAPVQKDLGRYIAAMKAKSKK
jgi:3,2-trans-enoyl-CoA isomerase